MDMKDVKEQLLIWRLKKHQDQKAADQLIRLYYKEIYIYVFRQVGEKEQAMDLTQDIFVSVLQSIWSYQAEKAGFRTWLYKIATHKVVDYYRSKAYKTEQKCTTFEGVELEAEWNVEDCVTNTAMVAQIFLYLKKQDVLLEEIFRLKFYGEYTFEEIGEILSLSTSTVKTKYYGAIQSIRKEFR